jgi:hypothetical protein
MVHVEELAIEQAIDHLLAGCFLAIRDWYYTAL